MVHHRRFRSLSLSEVRRRERRLPFNHRGKVCVLYIQYLAKKNLTRLPFTPSSSGVNMEQKSSSQHCYFPHEHRRHHHQQHSAEAAVPIMEDATTSSYSESSEYTSTREVDEEEEAMLMASSLATGGGGPYWGGSSSSPRRGVRMSSSLRRGAAAYAQLLESAVRASMETSAESSRTPAMNCDYYFDPPDSSLHNSRKEGTPTYHYLDETQEQQQQQQRPKRERDDSFSRSTLRRNHSRTEDLVQGTLVSHHLQESMNYGDDDGDDSPWTRTSSGMDQS